MEAAAEIVGKVRGGKMSNESQGFIKKHQYIKVMSRRNASWLI